MPPLTWEVAATLIVALTGLGALLLQARKQNAELERQAVETQKLRAQLACDQVDTAGALRAVFAELRPNHGTSARDAINRVEQVVGQIQPQLDEVREADRRHDAELARIHKTQASMGERLANADLDDRSHAAKEHAAIRADIHQLRRDLP